MIGRTLSHYKVLEEISRGGMGIVYKALDLKLNREVALKVLPPELVSDPDRKRRFVQEAQAAAALKHPNIAVVYEIDDVDGVDFIAMELIEGEKLSERIARTPLSIVEALGIARQVAEGLADAHEKGIVHRDLKPANIVMTLHGQPKIIDFGLAKLIDPLRKGGSLVDTALRLETEAGVLLGTVSYMSPEQARGQSIDHRSDVFSLGTVFYLMATGHHPFERATAADTVSAILNEVPAAPPEVPRGVRAIFEGCLAKKPDDRYETASELADALRNQEKALQKPRTAAARSILVVAILLLLVGGTWWVARRDSPSPESPPEVLSILIADFDNRTGESIFDGAIEQALALSLEGASFVTIFDRARARQQLTALSPASEGRLDETMTRLVCRSQGIELALTGSVEPDGSGYRVHVSALDPVTAEVLAEASERVTDKAGILRGVDRLASDLRGDLGDIEPASRLAFQEEGTFTTSSLDAMQPYAAAQELLHSGNTDEAIQKYEEAISHDPDFGRAYTGIGVALMNLDQHEEARPYFEKALTLIHRMTDRENLNARGIYYMYTHNYPKAIDEYTELAHQFPSADVPNLPLAYFYTRDFDLALEAGRRAIERQPSLLRRLNVAIYATYAGHFTEAIKEVESVLSENPAYHHAHVALAQAWLANGEPERAGEAYQRLEAQGERGASLAAMGLADLALYRGKHREAEDILVGALASDIERGDNFAAAKKLSALAEIEALDGRAGAALESVRQALSRSHDLGTRFCAAMIRMKTGDRAAALDLVDTLASNNDAESKALAVVLRGEAALREENPDTAIATLLEARQIADTWLGRFALGRAYIEAGAFAEASSELEMCLRRKGEATALFLDDVPTFRIVPEVYYYLGLSQEGLGSKQGAAGSYREFLQIKSLGEETEIIQDAKRRLETLE